MPRASDYSIDEVKSIVGGAQTQLVLRDYFLFKQTGQELAIAHRFALYLEPLFPGWNVDVEYNRVGTGSDPKARLNRVPVGRKGTFRPDILIHQRAEPDPQNNLLMIELKVGPDGHDVDLTKLTEMVRKNHPKIRYTFGYFVAFNEQAKVVNFKWLRRPLQHRSTPPELAP